jgi:peptide/nickel transport system permease protein
LRTAGLVLLCAVIAATLAAPWLAPNDPNSRFADLTYAPPTRVHLSGETSVLYIYAPRLINRLERRFEEDRARQVPLRFLRDGRLLAGDPRAGAPLLLLGADGYGRDIFSRLLFGGRATLAVALIATLGAAWLGTVIGGISGSAGRWLDAALSRLSEFVLVLPTIYVALALRAVMPLVLTSTQVFLLLVGIFTLLGWPIVARGVRAIVLAEREREYVMAARAAGAAPGRVLIHHLLPAARGYVFTQASLLLPAFILAEATMSFVGLGFPQDVATWGTMLQDAVTVAMLGDAPWTLAPAIAIFLVVLSVNIAVRQPSCLSVARRDRRRESRR